MTCGSGMVCTSGTCTNACASSDGGLETLCTPDSGPPYCANTQSDNVNCGTCGTVCVASTCVAGTCVSSATTNVEIFPPSGTLYDPGSASVWGGRYYTITFASAQTIVGIQWRANIATADSMYAEIWDPIAMTSLAKGTTVNGSSAEQFYSSPINYTVKASTAYLVGIFMSNASTVFPRKDTPSFPFTVTGPYGNITISACWSTSTANTDIFPTSTNIWGPDFKLDIQ